MNNKINRRHWFQAAGASLGIGLCGFQSAGAGATTKILDVSVISKLAHRYHGWPTLARRKNGELLLVCSGGRESHVCPFGRVELMRSSDGGKTWSWPRVLLDGPIDDRDAGVVETARGSILVTTFTSLAFEPMIPSAQQKGSWSQEKLARWTAARDRISAEQRQKELGVWMIRSTDGGTTWSSRYDCRVNSPHGPMQLSDGRLLYAGKELWHGERRIGVCESNDDGKTWRWLAAIPTRQGDNRKDYHELHCIETKQGRLIAQIRNHNSKNRQETLQTESTDGGKTWSIPHSIGVWGYPSQLLKLGDGRLLMTYGHRRAPIGCQARLSEEGRTWSDPLIIYGDAASSDMGYPTTVQLDDETLVTAWYEVQRGSANAVLKQARWKIRD